MPKTYWFSHGASQNSMALTVLLMEGRAPDAPDRPRRHRR